jgi:hypothetical protein
VILVASAGARYSTATCVSYLSAARPE